MKKLFLSIALMLSMSAGLQASASTEPVEAVYVRVNRIDQIGTPAELSIESKKRQGIVKDMAAKGFQFIGLVTNPKGQCPGRYVMLVRSAKPCK